VTRIVAGVAEQRGAGAASWSMLIFTVVGSMTGFHAEFTGDRRGLGVLGTVSDWRGSKSSLKVSSCDDEGVSDLVEAATVIA
jgi:hypothetical protein